MSLGEILSFLSIITYDHLDGSCQSFLFAMWVLMGCCLSKTITSICAGRHVSHGNNPLSSRIAQMKMGRNSEQSRFGRILESSWSDNRRGRILTKDRRQQRWGLKMQWVFNSQWARRERILYNTCIRKLEKTWKYSHIFNVEVGVRKSLPIYRYKRQTTQSEKGVNFLEFPAV